MEGAQAPEGAAGTLSLSDPKLKAFLGSTLLALPGLTWQAWVLGVSFRQRRGKPVADTNALAEGAAALQAAASAARRAAGAETETTEPVSAPAIAPAPSSSGLSKGRPLLFIAGVTFLFLFAKSWLARVLALVPEPYLDEVFHIPQAQTYCAGRWLDWDDKITTPPGLYVVSVALRIFWMGGEDTSAANDAGAGDGCSVWALRAANNVAIMLVAVAASSCRAALEASQGKHKDKENRLVSLYAFHSAINVALFPVLFFFSALYYTDVYSTLAVLLAYRNHLYRVSFGSATAPVWTDGATILLGLVSLVFRQTNIFWVVVYIGGLEAVHAVKHVRSTTCRTTLLAQKQREQQQAAATGTAPFGSLRAMLALYSWKYAHGDVHDPPLRASWPDDWALSLVASVGIAAVCNLPAVLRQVWPHMAILASFAGFVAWNGGVVLGDKANHVATLHVAQLMYVWALMAFFSAPLFVVHALGYAQRALSYSCRFRRSADAGAAAAKEDAAATDDAPVPPLTVAAFASDNKLLRLLHIVFVKKAYYPLYLVAVFDAMLAVVRYNTLVHPFTLADNRHYMFYVFRYTIRHSLIRYALVPAYGVCAWACWRILWAPPGADEHDAGDYSSPFVGLSTELEAAEPVTPKQETGQNDENNTKGKKGKKGKGKGKQQQAEEGVPEATPAGPAHVFLSFLDEDADGAATAARTGPTTTTALLWLAATSLSLVTAPLVEPRYFILPWVFWRLLVPAATRSKVDGRLLLETVWFVAINMATMYMFLYRPYVWRAADGTVLDGGRLQRFMW